MSKPTVDPKASTAAANFLRPIVQADLDSGKHAKIITRFPPCLLYTSPSPRDS